MKDFNISPYYDDFNADKNFHKILFKPGVSVQARELTQLQSILQDQILKFGNHVFKHGSVVIPGNSNSELNAPYVKLQNLSTTELAQLDSLEGAVITGNTTQIKALIRKVVKFEGNDPTTLYVRYDSQGINGESVFNDDEVLTITNFFNVTTILEDATGLGSLATINEGVYYINGNFVSVSRQIIPIEKYSQVPSKHVLLKITEEIIDSDMDQTLLDPAQGSYNFSAPGADRYKITLTLTTLPLGSTIDNDYVELMRYNKGILEEHARYPKYNELEKSLARRTYDESGDYVVNGLEISTREHLRVNSNNGLYSSQEGGSRDKFVVEIDPGKAYIQGFENEKLAKTYLSIDKGRTADHIKTKSNIGFFPKFGQYLYISDLKNLPNLSSRPTIKLFKFDGVQLGTAKVMLLNVHLSSSTAEQNIYKLFVYDVDINGPISSAHTIKDSSNNNIGIVTHRVGINNSGADFLPNDELSKQGFITGKVVQYLRVSGSLFFKRMTASSSLFPIIGDKLVSGTKEGIVTTVETTGNYSGNTSIIELPYGATYRVRKEDNTVDTSYTVFKQINITLVDGVGSGSIVGAIMESFDQADPIVIHSTLGTLPVTSSNVSITSNTVSISGLTGINGLVSVIVSAKKNNQANKTKTLTTITETIAASSKVLLSKCDIYRINTITDVLTGANITQVYTLDNGQRDYAYENGSLNLVGTLPTGNITVTYQYFQHSGGGDFFTVDSYELSGLGVEYYDNIPEYRSATDGKLYKLKNCLDFRPRIHNGDTSLIDLVQIDSRLSTSIRYYVPRYDLIIMDKSGKIKNITGTPADNPIIPKQPSESILLGTLSIPAYTTYIKNINIVKAKNQGYTMSEISNIEDRIYRLEQYSLLTQSEKTLLNTEVVDAATGLTRFKSGYLVDTFDDPDNIGDAYNPEYSAAIIDGILFPRFEYYEYDMTLRQYINITWNAGGFYTLPYSETVFAQQNLSSRITNINSFSACSWKGNMTIWPSSDTDRDSYNLSSIFNPFAVSNTISVSVPVVTNLAPIPAAPVPVAPVRPAGEGVILNTPSPQQEKPIPPARKEYERVPIASVRNDEMTKDSGNPVVAITSDDVISNDGDTFTTPIGANGCFTVDTKVLLASGELIDICQVKFGDRVWNWNKTRVNTVKFIEIVDNVHNLYSPNSENKPFATSNHPLYISGVLSTIEDSSNYENWLGKMARFKPYSLTMIPECKVYNLWVDGDNTYTVNGYGTHSIIGDGGWLVQCFEQGLFDYKDVINIFTMCSLDNNTQLGAIIINNRLKGNKFDLFNRILSKSLTANGIRQKILLKTFKFIGKLFQKVN